MTPRSMKGVVFRGSRTVEVLDLPVPSPGPGEVLIQMKVAAVCGSDLHDYRRDRSEFAGRPARIPGHEPAGVVAELGPRCQRVQVGGRVSIYHYMGCGHCAQCRSGYIQYCPERRPLNSPTSGPDADYMVVDERNCLLLPDALSFEDGALIACIAGTCYSAMRKLQPDGETDMVIFGQGPVGLIGTIMAKALGARVISVDPSPPRLELARALGADVTLNPSEVEVGPMVRELTQGRGADRAFETSGSAVAHRGVIDVLGRNGVGVFVGFGRAGESVDLTAIIGKQLTLRGSFVMPIHWYDDLVRFLLRHDLPSKCQTLITHRYPITEAATAFAMADSAQAGKVVFVWEQCGGEPATGRGGNRCWS